MINITPEHITELDTSEIFVFGSNLAGIHGSGAAKTALTFFGAKWGQGVGLQGQSYAIPTKDFNLKPLDLDTIEQYVVGFIKFALEHKNLTFYVTKVGCGFAGYKPEDIAVMFYQSYDIFRTPNIFLPQSFYDEEDKWDEYCQTHG
jgi:hypothetical protein